MLNKIITVFAFVFIMLTVSAQKRLALKYQNNVPYVEYQVQPGETLSGIARQFGTDIGTAMRFNHFNANSKLEIGKLIKIPVNLSTIKQNPANTAMVHYVQPGETLYRISVNHNKVPVEAIKEWNGLTDNSISVGQPIIIGYLQTNAIELSESQTPSENYSYQSNNNTVPPSSTAVNNSTVNTPPTVPATGSVKATQAPQVTENKGENEKAVNEESRFELPEKVKEKEAGLTGTRVSKTGFFTPLFGVGVEGRSKETVSGTAMTFKSSSGWSDKKYYILMNDIPPGSIVKISNGKSNVYARVLWNLGDIKENEGIDFRISNAAAAELGISENKFTIEVTYFE